MCSWRHPYNCSVSWRQKRTSYNITVFFFFVTLLASGLCHNPDRQQKDHARKLFLARSTRSDPRAAEPAAAPQSCPTQWSPTTCPAPTLLLAAAGSGGMPAPTSETHRGSKQRTDLTAAPALLPAAAAAALLLA